MTVWPGIFLVEAMAPARACAFLGIGDVLGSGDIWEEAGAWLIRIGVEEWVVWVFLQGNPCFGLWILLGTIYFEVLGGILRSGGVWYEGGGLLGLK